MIIELLKFALDLSLQPPSEISSLVIRTVQYDLKYRDKHFSQSWCPKEVAIQ